MKIKVRLKILLLLFLTFIMACNSKSKDPEFVVSRGDLSVGFQGNGLSSEDGLSGIVTLKNKTVGELEAVRENTAFLNYEHILTGFPDGRAESGFTPREGPFPLAPLPEGDGVQLVRQASDEPWNVSSTLTLRVVPPHYIDFDFEVTFHDASLFDPHAVFFFANSMNWVSDAEIHFRGQSNSSSTSEEWVKSKANEVDPGDSYISNSSQESIYGLEAPIIVEINLKNEKWPRIAKPFYYGHTGNGSVFALMFDHLKNQESEIRFTVMRWDLKERPSPFWDFAWVVYNPQDGQKARLQGRLLFKRFVSPEDVYEEFQNWQASVSDK